MHPFTFYPCTYPPVLWAWIRAHATHFLGARILTTSTTSTPPAAFSAMPQHLPSPFSVIILSSQYPLSTGPYLGTKKYPSFTKSQTCGGLKKRPPSSAKYVTQVRPPSVPEWTPSSAKYVTQVRPPSVPECPPPPPHPPGSCTKIHLDDLKRMACGQDVFNVMACKNR